MSQPAEVAPTAAEPSGARSSAERGALSARATGGWTLAAAAVDAVAVVSLLLFYALEVGRPMPHLFGPLSDGGSALFDLLLLPLLWFVAQRFEPRTPARRFAMTVLVVTALGALNSALLVLHLIGDAASLVLTLAVIVVQAAWFVLMGRRGASVLGLSRGLTRWALLGGVGMLAAMVLFVPAMLLPPTSPVALVLWIAVGLVGGLAWISWPAWFAVVGRRLQRQSAVDPR